MGKRAETTIQLKRPEWNFTYPNCEVEYSYHIKTYKITDYFTFVFEGQGTGGLALFVHAMKSQDG